MADYFTFMCVDNINLWSKPTTGTAGTNPNREGRGDVVKIDVLASLTKLDDFRRWLERMVLAVIGPIGQINPNKYKDSRYTFLY